MIHISCEEAANFMVPDLSFSNGSEGLCKIEGRAAGRLSGARSICGGEWTIDWRYSDPCGRTLTYTQQVMILPAPLPTWIDPPQDTILSCSAVEKFVPNALLLSNGNILESCRIDTLIAPVVTNSYDDCGGFIQVDWEWVNPCGEKIDYRQTITVIPLPDPEWINPPANDTISCVEAVSFAAEVLAYAGGNEEDCSIAGTIAPEVENNYNSCGGEIAVTWTYSSPCGRISKFEQIITVEPLPEPEWENLPSDRTITCAEAFNFVPDTLSWSNFSTEGCLVTGLAIPQVVRNFDACGGAISVVWELPGICSDSRTFTQRLEVLRAPAPEWAVNPGDTVMAYRDALNYSGYALPYGNFGDDCTLTGAVSPVSVQRNFSICGGSIAVEWLSVSDCGDSLRASQVVTVEAAPAPQVDFLGVNPIICEYDYLRVQPSLINPYPDMDYRWEYSPDGVNFVAIPDQVGQNLSWGPLSVEDEGFVRLVFGMEADDNLLEACMFESPPLPFQVVPRSVDNLQQTICEGSSVFFAGQELFASGTYIDTLGSLNGCDSIVVLSLEVLPRIENDRLVEICSGDTVYFGGENLFQAGLYRKIFPAANGCDSIVNLDLRVNQGSEASLQFELCSGDTLRLLDMVITAPASFSRVFNDLHGCDSIVHYDIAAVVPPQLDFSDYYICPGEKVRLDVQSAVPVELQWESSATLSCTSCNDPVASPLQTTQYVFSAPGCHNEVLRDTITVFVEALPQLLPIENINLAGGETVEVTLQSSEGEALFDVQWRDETGKILCEDCPRLRIDGASPERIIASAANAAGCRSEIAFEILKAFGPCEADQIEVANTMTLNNDGINEFMEIKNQGRARIESVQVFTRWGELIFSTGDPAVKWNGTIAGEPVNQGVYVYLIRGTCANGRDPFVVDGNITILR
jgi:gliding motility-associated-like protein